MTANSDALLIESIRQIGENTKAIKAEMIEDRKLLNKISDRLTRLESNRLEADVAALRVEFVELRRDVDALKQKEDRREGAMSVGQWIIARAPWLVMVFLSGLAVFGFARVEK